MPNDRSASKRTDPQGGLDRQSATQARLTDFDIDGAEVGVDGAALKPNHKLFLLEIAGVIKDSPGKRFTIAIGGFADTLNRSGHFDNKALSERRAKAVELFLRSALPPGAPVTFDLKAFGESEALPPNTPSAFGRAVDVALIVPGDPAPRRPHIPNSFPHRGGSFPRPQGRGGLLFGCAREFEIGASQNFKIRIMDLTIGSLGPGAKGAKITLQIVDRDLGLGAEYSMIGGDLAFTESLEATFIHNHTSYKEFNTTPFPTRVTSFRRATLKTAFGNLREAKPLGPIPPPVLTLTFTDSTGASRQVDSPIDMAGKEGVRSRFIVADLSLNTTCRGGRGALEIDRTNEFL